MNTEQAFGLVLSKYRKSLEISQEELAHRSNLDRTFISLLERGHRNATLNTLFALCRSLDVKPSDLIREVEEILIEQGVSEFE